MYNKCYCYSVRAVITRHLLLVIAEISMVGMAQAWGKWKKLGYQSGICHSAFLTPRQTDSIVL